MIMESNKINIFKKIILDKSFGLDTSKKIEHYAQIHKDFSKTHPLSLIYSCCPSDDVNDCVKLVSSLSKFYDHEIKKVPTDDIIKVIDYVMNDSKSNIETIIDCEQNFFDIIINIPLIFFKVCNERKDFNKNQLVMMLKMKESVENKSISQHDASVNIGSVLVDKYVKNKIQ